MSNPTVQSLIVNHQSRRGKGSDNSPIRVVTEVFTFDGDLIAESDPNSYTQEEVLLILDKAIALHQAGEMVFHQILEEVLK